MNGFLKEEEKKTKNKQNKSDTKLLESVLRGPFTVEDLDGLKKNQTMAKFNTLTHHLSLLEAVLTIEYLQDNPHTEILKDPTGAHLCSHAEAMVLWLVGCSKKDEIKSKVSNGTFNWKGSLSDIAEKRFQDDTNIAIFHKEVKAWNEWMWDRKMGSIMKAWEGHIVAKKDFDGLKADFEATKVKLKDYDGLKKDHDGLKKDHDGLKKDHDGLKKDYGGLKADFEAAKVKLDLFQSKFERMFPE